MGFRFRKRLRIIPGLFLNRNKRGGSLSLGAPPEARGSVPRRDSGFRAGYTPDKIQHPS